MRSSSSDRLLALLKTKPAGSGRSSRPPISLAIPLRSLALGLGLVSTVLTGTAASAAAAEDRVIADFEGEDFAGWEVSGEAFGKGPAHGALPNQMAVEGFAGKGFASSYHGGDDSTGRLVSPAFKIERKYLNFLIGGGGFTDETCIHLSIDGKVVRAATGRNVSPGGSERLDWKSWNLSEFAGKSATLEILDTRKGGWGHLSIDQIVQSDAPKVMTIRQEFTVNQRYLVWPVSKDRDPRRRFHLQLSDGGKEQELAYSDIRLSNKPDFWVFTDLANYQGRKLVVTGELPAELAEAWKQVSIRADYPGMAELYQEALRPQYHFTSRRGWLNDPNGLVWKDGKWHLFYQHNPYNHGWDNMHWGHAISPDLFHWTEGPDALLPDAEGYMYSGSGFVVPAGKSALPGNDKDLLGFAYTAEGTHSYQPGLLAVQSVAVSSDGGKTLQKFAHNPVLPHQIGGNRDPKIFWHEPTKHWVMALYHDGDEYGIYTSPDLVKWERTSTYRIPRDGECPDLFELAVDGNPQDTRWVVWGATGYYRLGRFDGRTFTPESESLRRYFGAPYAGQTYDHAPDGRRVHIGWMRDTGPGFEGMPFNLQMSLPMDFSLRKEDGEVRLWIEPSREVEALRQDTREWKDLEISAEGKNPLADFKGGQYEIEAVIDAGSPAAELGFRTFGVPSVWKKEDGFFTGMGVKVKPVAGKLQLRLFVDTVTVEVFVNGNYAGHYLRQSPDRKPLEVVAEGGAVRFESLRVHTLRSVWPKAKP